MRLDWSNCALFIHISRIISRWVSELVALPSKFRLRFILLYVFQIFPFGWFNTYSSLLDLGINDLCNTYWVMSFDICFETTWKSRRKPYYTQISAFLYFHQCFIFVLLNIIWHFPETLKSFVNRPSLSEIVFDLLTLIRYFCIGHGVARSYSSK